jgi:hypothetical protein
VVLLCLAGLLAGAFSLPLLAEPQEKNPSKPSQELVKPGSNDGETSTLRIEVTAGEDGKPVDQASVYVRWERERKFAKDEKFEQNWKTNRDGVVKVPNIPRRKVVIQVIAPGWKTFGQWYEIKEAEQTIKIRLQRPPKWY